MGSSPGAARAGCAAVVMALALLLPEPSWSAPAAALKLEDCRLVHPEGLGSTAARCGHLSVPEDPQNPAGRHIELAVAVVPAIAASARPDPLFLLAGGPGEGARDAFVPLLGALAGIRRERDIVLVDQRGTGDSNPMRCKFQTESLADDDSPARLKQLAEDCLKTLPGDPRFYTTSVAVGDLDAVRAALGYQRINLYGGSYGTRVAQQYVRRYPARVRTVILDGVISPTLVLGPTMAIDAESALRAAFARCEADSACAARYPGIGAEFDALRERLDRQPVEVRLPDPITAEPREVGFAGGQLALAARMFVYSDRTVALLPLLIDQAQKSGNFAPLAAQAELLRDDLQDKIAYGMHNSVVCSEDIPYLDPKAIDRAALDKSFIGSALLDGLRAMCSVWPRGIVDPDQRKPLHSRVPALLLSGQFDPVTPPAYAAEAAAGFTDHVSVTFAGQGHIQLGLRCAQSLIRHFLEAGTAKGLDTHCVDTVRPAPFFLNFNGGQP